MTKVPNTPVESVAKAHTTRRKPPGKIYKKNEKEYQIRLRKAPQELTPRVENLRRKLFFFIFFVLHHSSKTAGVNFEEEKN